MIATAIMIPSRMVMCDAIKIKKMLQLDVARPRKS